MTAGDGVTRERGTPATEVATPLLEKGNYVGTDAPCAICDEPRGDITPCPHCGME